MFVCATNMSHMTRIERSDKKLDPENILDV